jgi:uncharacterized protein YwbE
LRLGRRPWRIYGLGLLALAMLALFLYAGAHLPSSSGARARPHRPGEPVIRTVPPADLVQPETPAPAALPETAPSDPEPPNRTPAPKPSPPPSRSLPGGALSKDFLKVGGVAVTLLRVPLGSHSLRVGLAKGRVGCTEDLAAIARREGAAAAINGSFFDAYSNRPVRNPYGALISAGRLLHVSDHPTTLGAWPDGTVAIGQVRFRVEGDSGHHDNWLRRWYAYGLNDYPEGETWAAILTPQYAQSQSPPHGLHVVIEQGEVTAKGYGSVAIPAGGYVVYLRGAEAQLDKRFEIGRRCSYEVLAESSDGLDWPSAQEALGCGPLLLSAGQVSVNPRAEGFKDPKVLSLAANRSAIGLTADGYLLLATTSAATMTQLARTMQALGCRDAMNLDGGASSGLYCQGAYLTRPGRNISNALLVVGD